ncbi:hypothetical protein KVK63_04435 [Helicobacter pylori]|nr:hypothetical protein KVK63_04435 [Helicobacter pylori]
MKSLFFGGFDAKPFLAFLVGGKLQTQQAMRDVLKGENLETIEDFFCMGK